MSNQCHGPKSGCLGATFKGTWLVVAAIFLWGAYIHAEGTDPSQKDSVKIVFFVPSDIQVPSGAHQRITRIADAAEAFFFNGMIRQGYPPATKNLFRREADGQVELLQVHGDEPVASGQYDNPNCADYIIKKAVAEYHLQREGTVWWIFMCLGDQPKRFETWMGSGNFHDGGWGMINYDTVPGEIRPDLSLTEGFNAEFALKSVVHELGHAFGLPHMGPDLTLGLGNSLMGPNPPEYAKRHYPNGDRTYLAASEAAMLWKHPLFSGKPAGPSEKFDAHINFDPPVYHPEADAVTISGKFTASLPAHSVVLIDDRGDPSEYWSRSYAARLAADGTFQIQVNEPAKVTGHYKLLFCFDNGWVSGGDKGGIRIPYRFGDGHIQLGE